MNTEIISNIFDIVYERDALIIKPATDFEINRCNGDLESIGLSALPADYAEFLRIANGFAWNGFEFYGTYQVTVKVSGYVLSDIVSRNERYSDRAYGQNGMIVLGRFDDDTYVYDPKSGKYVVMDCDTVFEIEEYDSFDELFDCTVGVYTFIL